MGSPPAGKKMTLLKKLEDDKNLVQMLLVHCLQLVLHEI